MKALAMIRPKHWPNAWSVMRTANGLGFDYVFLVDLILGKIPRMNRRKIDIHKPPHDMFVLLSMEQFMEKILPEYSPVSMEITDDAEELFAFMWPENPLIILGPENGDVPDEILEVSQQVKVTMNGDANCLNVACAASMAMYDYTQKVSFYRDKPKGEKVD